jgi:protein-tyrosine sulfotransferase
LDVHQNIKCGPETKVIPTFIGFVENWQKRHKNMINTLKDTGISKKLVDSSIIAFINKIMLNRGLKAPRMCAKDPDIVKNLEFMHELFPKAKFIYMVRDGRAASYSLMSKLEEKKQIDSFISYLKTWEQFNFNALNQCQKIGPDHCLIVKYEDLVLHPENTIKKVVSFLNEPFNDRLLKHYAYLNEIKISKSEWSSHQIVKPIHTESLTKWVGKIKLTDEKMHIIHPLLIKFNYSISQNFLNYNENQADKLVIENNKLIEQNRTYWENILKE